MEEEKEEEKKKLTIEEAIKLYRKFAEDLTKLIITRLEELIEHEETTHIALIATLRYSLKQVMGEMIAFRPESLPRISLEEIGLSKLYKVLEEIEKEESKKLKEYKKKREREETPKET